MSDLFKCTNETCEVKHKCFRQTSNPSYYRERRFEPNEKDGICMEYMPIYFEDIVARNARQNYDK